MREASQAQVRLERRGHATVWPGALALAALLAATAPVRAAAGGVPIAVYPVSPEGLNADEVADVRSVIESGIRQVERSLELTSRDPLFVKETCGRSPTNACLAEVAGDGVVLLARARREGIHVLVSIALVDGRGHRTRWALFLTTLSVQDARPCAQAIGMLQYELGRPLARRAPLPEPPLPPPPVAAARRPPAAAPSPASAGATTAPARAAAPPALAEPSALRPARPDLAPRAEPEEPPAAEVPITAPRLAPPPPVRPPAPRLPEGPSAPWSTGRVAGAWTGVGGLVLVGAGVAAGLQARSLERTLTTRFDAGTLTPADHASYANARGWSTAANVLLAAGGVLTANGATVFFLAPAVEPVSGGGVSVGVAGRF
jgi:hypothetical protein